MTSMTLAILTLSTEISNLIANVDNKGINTTVTLANTIILREMVILLNRRKNSKMYKVAYNKVLESLLDMVEMSEHNPYQAEFAAECAREKLTNFVGGDLSTILKGEL